MQARNFGVVHTFEGFVLLLPFLFRDYWLGRCRRWLNRFGLSWLRLWVLGRLCWLRVRVCGCRVLALCELLFQCFQFS
jgi:hypothetical protein